MFALDKHITLWLFNIQKSLGIGGIVKFFGVYTLWILLAIFLYLLIKTKGERRKIYSFGLLFLLLIFGRGILVEIIRFFYHRLRPFYVLGINPLENDIKSASFPSGHTVSMFLIALSFIFFKNKKYLWTGLALASIGAVARVMMGIHWFGDIVGGIILAILAFITVYLWILPPKLSYYKEDKVDE